MDRASAAFPPGWFRLSHPEMKHKEPVDTAAPYMGITVHAGRANRW